MTAIITQSLIKTYPNGKTALNDISLSIEEGKIFGFSGPNGAGTTTTVKLLSGMLAPTSGLCRVNGIDPRNNPEKVHAIAGIVTEHAQMYGYLTGLENLIFYGSLFDMSYNDIISRALELLDNFNLSYAKDIKLDTYFTLTKAIIAPSS